jgi:hypothetical protein
MGRITRIVSLAAIAILPFAIAQAPVISTPSSGRRWLAGARGGVLKLRLTPAPLEPSK